ncbi:MAG: hypothetical protein Kow00128_01580 [Deltaproteobacteria bacterium]
MLSAGRLRGIRVGGQWRFPVESLSDLPQRPATGVPNQESGRPEAPLKPAASEAPTLTGLVEAGGIHYRVAGTTAREVIEEVVRIHPGVPEEFRPALFRAIWDRESLCSTGVGHGIALPHPRMPEGLPEGRFRPGVGLHFLEHPVDFHAVDGEPVSVLFLVLLATPREHLRILSRISRLLREEPFREFLHRAPLRPELLRRISELERTVFPEGP